MSVAVFVELLVCVILTAAVGVRSLLDIFGCGCSLLALGCGVHFRDEK